eukprot:TRINITY_DN49632_c0_g1_i1.p1 TRINITY_DN49632_c0_g1~~TRINITY_DN49632_c0_g1_i1.p1  ORF type:complete len:199 (-),score=10.75 TRINITY_DN49632_c0_g1_i1:21-617(-)
MCFYRCILIIVSSMPAIPSAVGSRDPSWRCPFGGSSCAMAGNKPVRKSCHKQIRLRPAAATATTSKESQAALNAPDRWHAAVWRMVQVVPAGRVASYGDIARALGAPAHSRHVGKALRNLSPGNFEGRGTVPWWRVLNSSGCVSPRICDITASGSRSQQQNLLEAEGVEFVTQFGPPRLSNFAMIRWQFEDVLESGNV